MKFKATLNVHHENTYFMLYKHFKNDNAIAAFLFDHFLMSGKAMLEAAEATGALAESEEYFDALAAQETAQTQEDTPVEGVDGIEERTAAYGRGEITEEQI